MPRLTVGLPVRNGGRYIREAIESVQCPSFTDWILLVFDDSSPDDTPQIVRDLAARDDRIVLRASDGGPIPQAQNWSKVIELPATEFVSMFAHDDVMMPALLERQMRTMADDPAMAMCFAQGPFLDAAGNLVLNKDGKLILHPPWPQDRVWSRHAFGPDVVVGLFVHPSSVMMRTAIARSIGPFSGDMPLYLDIEYWSRLGACGTGGSVAGDLLRYRLNPQGVYQRCVKTGINRGDADKLFRRTIAGRTWDKTQKQAFTERFYTAHALRAFRAAEEAREKGDMATASLQLAICLAHGRAAGDMQGWIARWWNVRFLGKRFSSDRRRKVLSRIASAPIVRDYVA